MSTRYPGFDGLEFTASELAQARFIGMTGSWPNPIALWYEDADGIYKWDFALDAWTFYGC